MIHNLNLILLLHTCVAFMTYINLTNKTEGHLLFTIYVCMLD